ncbi:MAG: hypothetical protein AAF730_17630 [Bacteroidota bacterium]
MIFDIEHGRLDTEIARKIFREIAQEWEKSSSENPVAILSAVLTNRDVGDYCKGPSTDDGDPKLCRVMVASDFVRFNVDKSKTLLRPKRRPSRRDLHELSELGVDGIIINSFQTSNPYVWVTKMSELSPFMMLRDEKSRALEVRNQLGLSHLIEDQRLILLEYTAEFPEINFLTAPCFIEGCPSLIYRSTSQPDRWGRTVHLETLGDGLPEAVHPTVDFGTSFGGCPFKVHYIGELTPSKIPDWSAAEASLPADCNINTISNAVDRLIDLCDD